MAEQYSIVYMCHHSFLWLSNIPLHICTLSPFDCKEIKPVNPKGNQSWIFIGRTDAAVKALILGHLMWRTDSLEKTLMLGKIEGRRRSGWQRMRLLGWHHWLDGYELEQALGVSDIEGGLAWCSPWDYKELDTTEQLNWTDWCITSFLFIHLSTDI